MKNWVDDLAFNARREYRHVIIYQNILFLSKKYYLPLRYTMSNSTLASILYPDGSDKIDAEQAAIMIAAIGAAIASVVYSFKHIKSSTCCAGFLECEQVVEDEVYVEDREEKPHEISIV